jgi:hypothetical protein
MVAKVGILSDKNKQMRLNKAFNSWYMFFNYVNFNIFNVLKNNYL